jgi:hypothetical protein
MEVIQSTLKLKRIDCFVASETWFREHHIDSLVSIPDYICFRDDRCERVGGGVAIWSKVNFCPERIFLSGKPAGMEAVAIKLHCKMFILGCYIPPQVASSLCDSVSSFLIDTIDSLLNEYPTFDVILCGDFNRLRVSDICSHCNLFNLHNNTTYGDAELDYILVSENLVSNYSVCKASPIDVSSVPHASLLATPNNTRRSQLYLPRQVFDLRASHVSAFIHELRLCDWSFVKKESLNIDEKCKMFHCILDDKFNSTIPVKFVTFTSNTKPWITPLVKSLINDRWRAYREKNFKLYNHLKLKVRKEIEKSKSIWAKTLKRKDIWKTTSQILGRKTGDAMNCFYNRFPSVMSAANIINYQFSRFFSEKKSVSLPRKTEACIHVSVKQVERFLTKLPMHKASPDIPNKLYKAAADILSEPLAHLFMQSIRTATVPTCWKISAVSPLPKTSSPSSTDELRPISLLPIPAKILERVILDFAKPIFLQEYGDDQYGFRSGSSTTCALIALHDHITKCLDDSNVVGVQVIAYDFSKAFDRIRHDVIISHLIKCNMPSELILWIASYLDSRQQYVKIGTECSSRLEVTSGVPQGSVLGPFLFSIVVGSLSIPNSDCRIIKFADDITISIPLYKHASNIHVSQIHDMVVNWSNEVGLLLNAKKCKTMLVPRTRDCKVVYLPEVANVKTLPILGVTFNSLCSWSEHMTKVARSASRRLFPLRLLKPLLDPPSLKVIYFGIMRSVMEYAAPLFVNLPKKDSKMLQALQNRFHRILCGKECREECLPLLAARRENLSIRLYQKAMCQDNHILKKILCPVSSRGRLILPSVRTSRRLKSFAIQGAILLNNSKSL